MNISNSHSAIESAPPFVAPPATLPIRTLERARDFDTKSPPIIWYGFAANRCIEQEGRESVNVGGQFTFSAWLWFLGSQHEPVFYWVSDDRASSLLIRRHGNGKIQLLVRDPSQQDYVWAAVPARTWIHVAATWSPGHLAVHLNGKLLAEKATTIATLGSRPRAGTFRIGGFRPEGEGPHDYLAGAMADAQLIAGPPDPASYARRAPLFASAQTWTPPVRPTVAAPAAAATLGPGKVPFAELYRMAGALPVDFEANLRAAYEVILAPGDLAVDVGAHRGKHTIPMAKAVGPSGYVYAFEPLRSAYEALASALKDHGFSGWTEAHNVAVSDATADSAEFFRVENRPGQSGLRKRASYADSTWRPVATTVKVTTLDEAVRRKGRLRFIKIDVEGAELHVLRGVQRLLTEHRPVVHFEFGRPSYEPFGVDPRDMFRFFADRDYRIVDILGRWIDSLDQFLESDAAPGVFDYIAVPTEEPNSRAMREALVSGWL